MGKRLRGCTQKVLGILQEDSEEAKINRALGVYGVVLTIVAAAASLFIYIAASISDSFDATPSKFSPALKGLVAYLILALIPPFIHETLLRARLGRFPIGVRSVLQLLFAGGFFWYTYYTSHGDLVDAICIQLGAQYTLLAIVPAALNFIYLIAKSAWPEIRKALTARKVP